MRPWRFSTIFSFCSGSCGLTHWGCAVGRLLTRCGRYPHAQVLATDDAAEVELLFENVLRFTVAHYASRFVPGHAVFGHSVLMAAGAGLGNVPAHGWLEGTIEEDEEVLRRGVGLVGKRWCG